MRKIGRKRRTEEMAKVWEQVEEISEDEVLTALKKMQGEKGCWTRQPISRSLEMSG